MLDVSAGLAALACLLDEAETLDQTEIHGLGVLCALLSAKLEHAGGEMLDALINQRQPA